MTPLKIGFPVDVTNDTSVGLNSPHRGEENGMDEVEWTHFVAKVFSDITVKAREQIM